MKRITLSKGKVALVDDEDFDWLNQWSWYADKSGNTFYARRNTRLGDKWVAIFMHQMLAEKMGFQSQADHIDRDGLNNQRSNLREATQKQNNENKGIRSDNNSGVKGVHWRKDRQKWAAQIRHQSKCIHLGYFDDIEGAAEARQKAEQEYFTHA